jgi:transcriptional regulator with XRE-family HTH domain
MSNRRFDHERIRQLREGLGWSAEELADRIGVARQTVHAWEAGQYQPQLDKLLLIVNVTGAKLDSFFASDPDRQSGVGAA